MRFRHTTTLGIYSLSAASMQVLEPLLSSHRGPISYCSLKGIKDLRLQSSGEVLPLLHVQWGNRCGQKSQTVISDPLAGYTHMFCVPQHDELTGLLSHQGIQPGAIASVISHGMDGKDWRFVLTSDI